MAAQLSLSVVARHTASGLMRNSIYGLNPRTELVEDICKEVVDMYNKEGWLQKALFNMDMLDNVSKNPRDIDS